MEILQDPLNQIEDPLNEIAEKHFGVKYLFPYQRLVISNILEITSGKNPDFPSGQIVILPTGAGKSLCFMLPAVLLQKPTLIIFPLLSLMADQKRRFDEAGLETAVLKGGQDKNTRKHIFKGIENGKYKVILTNPETLNTDSVISLLKGNSGGGKIGHVVIDEAHTVSEWGDSFRKSYLETGRLIEKLNPDAVTAFTATASEKILERLTSIIFSGKNINMISANPDRTNIKYSVIKTISREHDLIKLAEKCEKPAVIFCSSRVSAELTASLLIKKSSIKEVKFYHAGLEASEKKAVEKWFFTSSDGVLSSTCAYGLGVDKSNIRTVIHRELPGSVESYLQESGRGGRDRKQAYAVALFSESDRKRLEIFESDVQKMRYENLLKFADSVKTCRRKILLKSLSAETEYCEGCDICDKSFKPDPDGKNEIIKLIKYNNKMLTLTEAAEILKGTNNARRRSDFIWQSSYFGTLSAWSSDSIKEGINNMISSGEIRKGRFLRKNLLTLSKYANIKP
jgi:ATP-dependent DNA helicase RecQ